MSPPPPSFWIVDAIKAVASQLIVWHHFAAYGPMARVVYPYSERLMDWLYADARQVVQAFLVVGGYLAARALAPQPQAPSFDTSVRTLARLTWRRYVRLVRPYGVVLLLAVVAAALARRIIADEDTPAAPALIQVLIHVLLLHDVVDVDALSAGVWYVAIDFQLYCVFLLLIWLSRRVAIACGIEMRTMALLLVVGLSTSSLLWFNRDPAMDEWAFYFFGAYGLGIMVQWSSGFTRKHPWLAVFFGVVVAALALEWRSRLIVAVTTALILGLGSHAKPWRSSAVNAVMAWLSRISYAVFLIHYPIALIVGAIIARLWPDAVAMHATGLAAAWFLTLAGGTFLHNRVERVRPAPAVTGLRVMRIPRYRYFGASATGLRWPRSMRKPRA